MIRFLISRFFTKEKALDMLGDNEGKITEFSQNNPHLNSAIKTGFKIWSIWKLLFIIWYGFLFLVLIGGAFLIYIIMTKFI